MLTAFAAVLACAPFAGAVETSRTPLLARWLDTPVVLAQAAPPAKEAPKKDAPAKNEAPKPAPKAGAQKPATDARAAELAQKVQKFYEKTDDFSANFDQIYRYVAMGRTQKSSGTVQVKKPGLMRWDYVKPYPKAFVLDGKDLWQHEPEDDTVMVKRGFSTDSLSAAVTFLWGRGKLSDEFDIAIVERPDYGATVLELTPTKAQSGFTKLFFALDEATGAVKTSIVIDSQGNENRITFSNVKTNQGLSADRFRFTPPKGAKVSEWK